MNKLEGAKEIAPLYGEIVLFENAKPAIPIEEPKRREVPSAPRPLKEPIGVPQPKEPITTPVREPVPVGR